ncbi:OsmC family protein [Geofilum sp. OHC36d9]|uniref:OsmC family protein n=1 Tax=Geofilum sp. OHC36d9 TaxID=3458413 RepID=UPI004033FFDE
MANLTFSVKGNNSNTTRLDVETRQFKLIVDEPAEMGGNDEGPNPVEYILAGYAGCLNVVGHVVAKELGINLQKLTIEVSGQLNPTRFLGLSNDERAGFQSINVKLNIDSDATPDTLNQWLEAVENRCPVRDNLSNPTPLSISVNQTEAVLQE